MRFIFPRYDNAARIAIAPMGSDCPQAIQRRTTALEVCTKYSTCYQPARPFPHRSDSVKTVESFAQEEFQKEMLMRMKKLPCLEEDEATKLDVREAEGLWKQIMNDERSS